MGQKSSSISPPRVHRARRGWVNLVFAKVAAILGDGRCAGVVQHGQKDGGEGDGQSGLWGGRTACVLPLNRPSEFATELAVRHLLYVFAVKFDALALRFRIGSCLLNLSQDGSLLFRRQRRQTDLFVLLLFAHAFILPSKMTS